MTRIAIIGHGAMGREVERLAEPLGMSVSMICDVDRPFSGVTYADFDVVIDFSWPNAVIDNVRAAARLHRPIVIGTTGWYDHMDEVRTIVTDAGIGCVWGSNFNIGTHLFLRLVQRAAELIDRHPGFDVSVHETHHRRKRDSPSGTAITTAQTILAALARKSHMATETQHGAIDPAALHVTSSRVGEVIGRHQVTIDSAFESIEIIHSAKNRRGFAQGALLAASWVQHRTGWFDVTEIIDDVGS
jgi:4-hydroxy-tetrahydrodipicolinate reductase